MPVPPPDRPHRTPGFGDNVRVRSTPATKAGGYAGLAGQVHGSTVASCGGVTVIGEPVDDVALNVYFEDRNEDAWFAPALLEFIDHAPGTEIRLEGVPKTWMRAASGEWIVIEDAPPHGS
jgi:hypothetical protein